MNNRMEKYVSLAKELKMLDAVVISAQDICFDMRAILKCLWGCQQHFAENIKCSTRGTTYQERVEMVRGYSHILLLHSHDAWALSAAVLEIERRAFLDGYYFAAAIRACNLCRDCAAQRGEPCPTPQKVRPCDQSFGIDIYQTVRNLGLPCEVLQDKDEMQNRYGFVLLD